MMQPFVDGGGGYGGSFDPIPAQSWSHKNKTLFLSCTGMWILYAGGLGETYSSVSNSQAYQWLARNGYDAEICFSKETRPEMIQALQAWRMTYDNFVRKQNHWLILKDLCLEAEKWSQEALREEDLAIEILSKLDNPEKFEKKEDEDSTIKVTSSVDRVSKMTQEKIEWEWGVKNSEEELIMLNDLRWTMKHGGREIISTLERIINSRSGYEGVQKAVWRTTRNRVVERLAGMIVTYDACAPNRNLSTPTAVIRDWDTPFPGRTLDDRLNIVDIAISSLNAIIERNKKLI